MNTLFDNNGSHNLDDIISRISSHTSYLKGGIASIDKLKANADAAIASLRRVQEICNEEQQAAIVDAMSEMVAYESLADEYGRESEIEILSRKKEKELLDKYFPFGGGSGCLESETIGEYTKDLPFKIESEFRECLKELWKTYSDTPLVLKENNLSWRITEDDREMLEPAYEAAMRITLWERITKSNHKDVTFYKGLLHEYTRDLLLVMRLDFLEEVKRKVFEG